MLWSTPLIFRCHGIPRCKVHTPDGQEIQAEKAAEAEAEAPEAPEAPEEPEAPEVPADDEPFDLPVAGHE